MTFLVQNQTKQKVRALLGSFYKSAKSSAPDFPGPTHFCRHLLCFAVEMSAPSATLRVTYERQLRRLTYVQTVFPAYA
jgi:hypothetical protein